MCTLHFALCTFGNVEWDVWNADFLAGEKIIVDQSADASQYRLDESIIRQEMVAIALKIRKTALPASYTCKKYYSDVTGVTPNDWVCRSVEIAADESIISRNNPVFRPQDTVTSAEALAIIFRALGEKWATTVEVEEAIASGITFPKWTVAWQMSLMITAKKRGIIDEYKSFLPNAPATRGQIFDIATQVMLDTDFVLVTRRYHIETADIRNILSKGRMTYSFGWDVDVSKESGNEGQTARRTFTVVPYSGDPVEAILWYYPYSPVGNITPLSGYVGRDILFVANAREFIRIGTDAFIVMPMSYFTETDLQISKISFGNYAYHLDDTDIIKIYYSLLLEKSYKAAHAMLSDKSIMSGEVTINKPDYEAFVKQFSPSESFAIKQGSFVNLGNGLYSFIVHQTTGGVETHYRVKMQVSKSAFQLQNISSIKL